MAKRVGKKEIQKESKQKPDRFEKFDKAEKELKEAEDAVQDLANDFEEGERRNLLTRAARDIEKAEAEVDEVDESCF